MGAVRIALFDRGHRLSGHPGKGLNFSFQGEPLGREVPMLQGVLVAPGGASAGAFTRCLIRPSKKSSRG